MKHRLSLMICCFACLLVFAGTVSAQDEGRAGNIQSLCAHWSNVRVNKHKEFKGESNDVYQTGACIGYINGLMDGMDNTGGWRMRDGSISYFQIKRSSINSTWDVIRAFDAYVEANPLSKGKPAWNVLQNVLTANGLGTFLPQTADSQASVLSDECKTGATNLLNQFNSDTQLRVIDTPTLAEVDKKLSDCFNTTGLTEGDTKLLLTATSEAELTLLTRAINVLGRHQLMPEFRAERVSTQSPTISAFPGGMTTTH